MTNKNLSIINIAIVGGGNLCKEVLKKTTFSYEKEDVTAPILAVADPDQASPGIKLAQKLGLLTFKDYRELYDKRYSIHLIIILDPDPDKLKEILDTRPFRIRILSFQVFNVLWKAIGREEHKLKTRNREIETIVNGIQDLIVVIEPDMTVSEANEIFIKKIGFSRKEVAGKKCYELLQQQDKKCENKDYLCPLDEVIRNKSKRRQTRTYLNKNGKMRHFEVEVHPIWEKSGKISKFIHISRDVTKRLNEEEEITKRLGKMVEERTKQLKETHNKLLHQDKMASLGKLSASVVHEINNPIAGILNLIILMKRIVGEGALKKIDIAQFSDYLDLMEKENRRISRIVSNLLAFSREYKLEMKQVNINRLLGHTLFLNSNLLKLNSVEVETDLAPNLPNITGSEDQIQQVFVNFVSNSTEAMENEKKKLLQIKTRHSLKHDKILVSFTDSGHGIPVDNYTKIFEPFYTTKSKGKGVGLGLSVAYGIIEEHGGAIEVESKPGKKTTFTVEFPVTPRDN